MSKNGQNRSAAVMAQRNPALDNLDDFPTPPWATRALLKYGIPELVNPNHAVLDPCCNRGHMVKPLSEIYRLVHASDVHDYGLGYAVKDFLMPDVQSHPLICDWVFINPPFVLAEEFIMMALRCATEGVAVFVRTSFIEGQGRYKNLFSKLPPTRMYQFSERVSLMQGLLYNPHKPQYHTEGRMKGKRVNPTATAYMWMIWDKNDNMRYPLQWFPPCRLAMEKEGDYPDWACYGDRATQTPNEATDERQRPMV